MLQNFWFFIAPYKKACTCSMFIYFSYIHAVFSKVISMHSCSFQVHIAFCTCKLQLSHSFYFSPRIYIIISMRLCNMKLCVYQNLILKFKFWYVVPVSSVFNRSSGETFLKYQDVLWSCIQFSRPLNFVKHWKSKEKSHADLSPGLCATRAQWPLAP